MKTRHAQGQREFWPLDGDQAVQSIARVKLGRYTLDSGYAETRFRCPVCQVGKCWAYRTTKGPTIYVRCQTFHCVSSEGAKAWQGGSR